MQTPQKILTLTVSSFLLLLSSLANAGAVINKEHQAVVDTAFNYFNGVANADQALLASAFDLDFGDLKIAKVDKQTGEETFKKVPFDQFAKGFKQPTKDTWTAKVLMVDIVDDQMAMVKLDFQTSKTHYIDYLVMYKREGQWKIVNKTFVANRK